MGKSVVDVQIEGVLAKILLNTDTNKDTKITLKLRYRIQMQNEDRLLQGYRYKDHPKFEIQNTVINIIYNRFELYGSSSSSNYNTDDIVIHICSMESIIKEEEG